MALPTFNSSHKYEKSSATAKAKDFDAIVFSQQWPATTCFKWKARLSSNKCILPKRETWSIHGVWPTRYHTTGPFFCNDTLHLNETALSPILHELDEKWKNIHGNTKQFALWQHQWKKHGTCATILEDLNTDFKYFQKGLDLMSEYDMTSVLAKSRILPGNNYAVEEIIDGVEKILGKAVVVNCTENPETQESYLAEIRICLSKSFKPTNCDDTLNSQTNCNRKMLVHYLRTTTSKYNNNQTNSISQVENNILLLLCTHIFYIAVYLRIKNI